MTLAVHSACLSDDGSRHDTVSHVTLSCYVMLYVVTSASLVPSCVGLAFANPHPTPGCSAPCPGHRRAWIRPGFRRRGGMERWFVCASHWYHYEQALATQHHQLASDGGVSRGAIDKAHAMRTCDAQVACTACIRMVH